jgi:hypothetical protein
MSLVQPLERESEREQNEREIHNHARHLGLIACFSLLQHAASLSSINTEELFVYQHPVTTVWLVHSL